MTTRQAARVAKAERLVREAIALLDSVDAELRQDFSSTVSSERGRIVHMASALERAL